MAFENAKHVASQRQAILAAAMKVFERHGYAAATVEQVAAEADIAKGSIYNYFKSKKELFEQILSGVTSESETEFFHYMDAAASAGAKLSTLLDLWFERLSQNKSLGRLVMEFWATAAREHKGELAAMFQGQYKRWRRLIAAILAKGAASGEFNKDIDPQAGAALLLAMLDGIHVQLIVDVGLKADKSLLEAMKLSMLRALGAPARIPVKKGNARGRT